MTRPKHSIDIDLPVSQANIHYVYSRLFVLRSGSSANPLYGSMMLIQIQPLMLMLMLNRIQTLISMLSPMPMSLLLLVSLLQHRGKLIYTCVDSQLVQPTTNE
jgi:hypothetical protein